MKQKDAKNNDYADFTIWKRKKLDNRNSFMLHKKYTHKYFVNSHYNRPLHLPGNPSKWQQIHLHPTSSKV